MIYRLMALLFKVFSVDAYCSDKCPSSWSHRQFWFWQKEFWGYYPREACGYCGKLMAFRVSPMSLKDRTCWSPGYWKDPRNQFWRRLSPETRQKLARAIRSHPD